MNQFNESECCELIALAALVFHDAVVMQACNQERASNGLSMAYGEGNMLDENAQKLQSRLKELEAKL